MQHPEIIIHPARTDDRQKSLQESALDELDRHFGAVDCPRFSEDLSIPSTLEFHAPRSSTTELHSQHLDADLR